ncbi:MAG TPA: Ku protein [Bryobacteraceae bacterium]|nr:Ku protein [Bryobacteraceae bacterium]
MASSVWKGHITFGLISLPVRLTAAARSETVSFNQLHKQDNSRVKQVLFCIAEDKPVPRNELVKGYEYEDGKYVVIDEEDIKKIQPKTAKVMEILEFVDARDVDAVYLESSYYLHPEEAGEKAYTVLFEALKRTGRAGVAKVTMHNREHVVILRPGKRGLMLHTMYYQDEVRASDEFRTDGSIVKDPEVAMAQQLIEALVVPFDPSKFSDGYRETLRAMIDAKISGEEVVKAPPAQELAPVIDIMEALKNSLVALRKPPAVETVTEITAKPKRRRAAG